jgi:hypothetical protein
MARFLAESLRRSRTAVETELSYHTKRSCCARREVNNLLTSAFDLRRVRQVSSGKSIAILAKTAPAAAIATGKKKPARKNSFREPIQSSAKTKTTMPKFFSCDFQKIMSYYGHPASPRGALRAFRHDTWGGDAMDVSARSASHARTNEADADVKSCGPDLPVLGSSW